MCSQSSRRPKACLALALCLACSLSLLSSEAAAVGLLDLAKAGTGEAAPAEPAGRDAGLWITLWSYFADLVGIAPPPPPQDAGLPGPGADRDEDQGVTLDPNG